MLLSMKPSRLILPLLAVLALAQDLSLIEPADLAKTLESAARKPTVICVAFPVLYRSKHITGALYAGPGNKPEGIEALKKAVAGMPKDADIVLYCGCCPMERCPNIRPAYQALKDASFTRVRVLRIPTNMSTDWYTQGYPSEAGPAGTGGGH